MSDEVQIQAVTFGEDAIEINYVEPRNITDTGILAHFAVIRINDHVATEADELRDAAEALLDRWLELRRSPPTSYKGRPRP